MTATIQALCLVALGFVLAITCVCALLTKIAADQRGAIGCFALVTIFCCSVASLLLWEAFL
jgi:hypothetical protein